jgi:CRISPR-associated endonuclease Cas1/CRISPR-associated protein Cas4
MAQSVVVPDLVPARMINEVLYCERLMYLEWSQGEFADNLDTEQGRAVHSRVDREGGTLPDPDAVDEPPVVARSVWLSSERLGMTAKIDLVESADGVVMPVEYKRGKRAPVPEEVWLPERAQLCTQILLLQDHGYTCSAGIVYFAAERRRVVVEATDELIATTKGAAARARELAGVGTLPPPLVNSPKCVRCSLAPICLPEEVNALKEERSAVAATVRRLYAANDDREPLYVQEHGARVGLDGETLAVRSRDGKVLSAPLYNTSQVSLLGNAQISTQALRKLMNLGIPVSFFTFGGWFVGRATGHDTNNVELRIAQYKTAGRAPFCLRISRSLVDSKIRNSRTLLRRNASTDVDPALAELRRHARKAREAESIASLLGLEGSAARLYFQNFSAMLKGSELDAFDLAGRNRRPPQDPINALLSLAYSLLTKDVAIALGHVGLDPLLGYYHQPRFGRPALALDLMEEFRPLIADSVVVTAINTKVVGPRDFNVTPVGTSLKANARRSFIAAYERRMKQLVTHPLFGYRLSYRRVLELQARLLARHILGELDSYPTFQTR